MSADILAAGAKITPLISEQYAFGIVIACSVAGIAWGLVNTLLVSSSPHKTNNPLLTIFARYRSEA
jgi:hypothetical protein